MQGNNYQIGKEPLLSLLLINPLDEKIIKQIKTFADNILHQKQTHGCSADTAELEA